MINVRMGDDDLLHREPMMLYDGHHVFDVIAGIDDHGLFGLFIADHRAISLQRADREDLVDLDSKLPRSGMGIHWPQEAAACVPTRSEVNCADLDFVVSPTGLFAPRTGVAL